MSDQDFKLVQQDSGETLSLGSRNTLGRGSDNDIQIDAELVSRKHAVIELKDGELTITDLGSSNGTFVNDQAIAATTALFNGDVIRFDKSLYTVESPVERPVVAADESSSADDAATMISSPKDDVTRIGGRATPAAEVEEIPQLWADKDGLESASQTQVVFDVVTSDDVNAYIKGEISVPALGTTPRLVGLSAAIRGKIYDLETSGETRTWRIGRADNLDIVIPDPTETVSGQHAQLVNEGQRWKIVNWMSTNGTFVNGRKGLSTYLKSGDIIRLGSMEFAFEIKAAPEQPAPVEGTVAPQSSGMRKWIAVGLGVLIAVLVVIFVFV